MAMSTFRIKFGWDREYEVKVQAAEKAARHFHASLDDLVDISSHCIKQTNHGKIMQSSIHFGAQRGQGDHPPKDLELWRVDVTTLFVELAAFASTGDGVVMSRKQLAEWQHLVDQCFAKHVVTIDERTTPEQDEAAKQERIAYYAKDQADREAAHRAWAQEWGDVSRGQIEVPKGMGQVIAQMVYDGSHLESDYTNTHASVGSPLLLQLFEGPETERTAREALAHYPMLRSLVYEWHTEKYANGHGNYLRSDVIGERYVNSTFGVVGVRWEIEFRHETHGPAPYYFTRQPLRQTA